MVPPCNEQENRRFGDLLEDTAQGQTIFVPVLVETVAGDMTDLSMTANTSVEDPADWMRGMKVSLADRTVLFLGSNRPAPAGEQKLLLGRGAHVDVLLPGTKVSKLHVTFTAQRAERIYAFTDEGSKNGTYINGERLSMGVPTRIWPGAYVTFADLVFLFLDPATLRQVALASKLRTR